MITKQTTREARGTVRKQAQTMVDQVKHTHKPASASAAGKNVAKEKAILTKGKQRGPTQTVPPTSA